MLDQELAGMYLRNDFIPFAFQIASGGSRDAESESHIKKQSAYSSHFVSTLYAPIPLSSVFIAEHFLCVNGTSRDYLHNL